MNQIEKCIYCGTSFDPTKGEGDHILPVQLGEFRNDKRFRKICSLCNNRIGRSEQQFLACGPESFFRDLVKPKIPQKRKRGCSKVKAAMGAPCPEPTIDHGDHRELVKLSKDNPLNLLAVDQIVIHDEQDKEFFIELFPGMGPDGLKKRVERLGTVKIKKTWIHCDDKHWTEFKKLTETWAKSEIQNLPDNNVGITQVNVRTKIVVTDHYFRSLAKIAFHYYLVHSSRGFRGDEKCFGPIRDFIMNGGNDKDFFNKSGPKFIMPFGKILSGGVITPNQWCHIMAADETDKEAVVYIQLFVGRGCVPTHITSNCQT
ncbi:MAG: hypothetical protein A2167_08755 [Planctomycetes bacterium RBG_13_46_10]|nr:MAG: hypothetical protein A2167_08755 [Planctomycetes bacterium RBG_13_46_10]